MYKVALTQVFLRLSPVSVIRPMSHIHVRLSTALLRRTSGLILETFKPNRAVSALEEYGAESCMHLLSYFKEFSGRCLLSVDCVGKLSIKGQKKSCGTANDAPRHEDK